MRVRDLHGGTRFPARPAAATGAMLTLLAVTAAASRAGGGGVGGPPGASIAATAGHHIAVVGTLVAVPIVAVAGCVLFFYAQIQRRREQDPAMRRRLKAARIRTVGLLGVAAGFLIYFVRTGRNPFAFLHLHRFGGHSGSGPAAAPHVPVHRPAAALTTVDWAAAVLLWTALAGTAAVLIVRRRRAAAAAELEPFELGPDGDDEPDLAALRRERNPRRAVIAAYAMMERLMARDGLPRSAHEAPMEYLGRVTRAGHARVAQVHRLTGLFQRARFSDRPVDQDMRRRALAAAEELAAGAGDAT